MICVQVQYIQYIRGRVRINVWLSYLQWRLQSGQNYNKLCVKICGLTWHTVQYMHHYFFLFGILSARITTLTVESSWLFTINRIWHVFLNFIYMAHRFHIQCMHINKPSVWYTVSFYRCVAAHPIQIQYIHSYKPLVWYSIFYFRQVVVHPIQTKTKPRTLLLRMEMKMAHRRKRKSINQ
jgi:hypothetical protein